MTYNVLDVCRYIINYSNERDYGVSNLKLQKLLYFVQAYYLIKGQSRCFYEKIEAWDFGPVVPEAYMEYKQFGGCDIPPISFYYVMDMKNIWNSKKYYYDDRIIGKADKKLINTVVDAFSEYSATSLVTLTHNQDPWIKAYVPYENREITLESIKEYFCAKR